MKRTKRSSMPTRIMPKRGKAVHNDNQSGTGGNSESTEPAVDDDKHAHLPDDVAASDRTSVVETAAPASVTARKSHKNHRKQKAEKTERVSGPQLASPSDAPELPDGPASRASPDRNCTICLSAVKDGAFTDACCHVFCFNCLLQWSRYRAVCPLCKKPFNSITHSFRSYDDCEVHQLLSPLPTSNSANIIRVNNFNAANFSTSAGTFLNSSIAVDPSDYMRAVRRQVYTHSDEMQLQRVWTSHHVSPAMFDSYPQVLEKVRPWILRDVSVIVGEGDVQHVTNMVLDLLRRFAMTSAEFYDRLFPHLGQHTRRFLVELEAFANSPFDMAAYDVRVMYRINGVEQALPTEHVEDISSGDDSDVEIVYPSTVNSDPAQSIHHTGIISDPMYDPLRFIHFFHPVMSAVHRHTMSLNSGMESPVPGPSGFGQVLITGENDSVGSNGSTTNGSRSMENYEEQLHSPLVLSDADSDVVVVNDDRSVRSPINISSAEDNDAGKYAKSHRRVKRRRRECTHQDCPPELPESEILASSRNMCPKDENSQSHFDETQTADLPPSDKLNVNECASRVDQTVKHADATIQMPNQYSGQSSSNEPHGNSSPDVDFLVSKQHLQTDVSEVSDTTRVVFRHQKRSRNAKSVKCSSVKSMSRADDVRPVTCKKHVSGHKSSKQKARELVAMNSTSDLGCDNAEKLAVGDEAATADGSPAVPGTCNTEHSPVGLAADVQDSSGEGSDACADLRANKLLVMASAEEPTSEHKLASCSQLDNVMQVPSTSETNPLPMMLSSSTFMENVEAAVTDAAACQDGPLPHQASGDADAYSCSSDVVHMHQLCTAELPKNTVGISSNHHLIDGSGHILPTAIERSPDGEQSRKLEVAGYDAEAVSLTATCGSSGLNTGSSLSSHLHLCSDILLANAKCEQNHSSLESSNTSITDSLPHHCELHLHPFEGCVLKKENISDAGGCQRLPHRTTDVLTAVPQQSETESFADIDHSKTLALSSDFNCTPNSADIQVSLPSPNSRSKVNPTLTNTFKLADTCTSHEQRSTTSPLQDSVVTDNKSRAHNSSVDDHVASPVGIDSSDTDSEVEWLELVTAASGRQRCISISSSESIICNPMDVDSTQCLLSDSDGLEMLDDEIFTCTLSNVRPEEENQSAELSCSAQAPLTNTLVQGSRSPDVVSSVDATEEKCGRQCNDSVNTDEPEEQKSDETRSPLAASPDLPVEHSEPHLDSGNIRL